MEEKRSIVAGLIEAFLKGNLAILLLIISLLAGAIALIATPREEEPQIVVPLADVMVSYPGGSAEEVEKLVAARLERMLYQVDGVEYVYSMSRPGMAVVTVRFFVGEDREKSLVKLYNKISQNMDKVTPGITGWVVKPIEIDDVPIVTAALYSDRYDTHQLRRVAEEVTAKLQHIPNSAQVTIHGGERRVVHVYLNPEQLAAHGLSAMEIAGALKLANTQMASGTFEQNNAVVAVETGDFLRSADEVRNLLVGLHGDRPVYLRDVARIEDGPEEPATYTRFGFGPAAKPEVRGQKSEVSKAAVTVAIAKKKGSNAVWVARDVEHTLEELHGSVIPDGVEVRLTRNYGETANEKVNGLVEGLLEAIITVIVLIWLVMNWRVGLIVAIAVPITYALTLLVNYLLGYTINRVTLFALILTLGLLVDDPIVGVENIHRHLIMRRLPRGQAILAAMTEVLPPIVIATLAIVIAFLPMFFITGMMGPYMRPMAVNVPIAMLVSMLVSLTITPWLSDKLLKREEGVTTHDLHEGDAQQSRTYRIYNRVVGPFVTSPRKGKALLWVMGALFIGSLGLIVAGLVPLKMLPFDNKNEFQVVVDMPEGTALETTDAAVRDLEQYLRTVPEVTDFTATVGASSPMDFNGLVRHYYLRQGPHVADVRISLLPRQKREMASHAIVLRLRADIAKIAQRHNANFKLVEMPPGPPVLATVVAEVYGQPQHRYSDLIAAARTVEAQMKKEEGVVDVDTTIEDNQRKLVFHVDREKTGLNGIATEDIVQTVGLALGGAPAGILHVAAEQNETPIMLRLPRAARSDVERLKTISVKGRTGQRVQIGELGRFEERVEDKTIFHKNQERVVFVQAEMAGRGPAYAVLALEKYFEQNPLPAGIRADWSGEGEWKITIDVFRDLGIAFSVALAGIYILLVYETASFLLPLIIMLSIPLTMIGIMPGFWLLNAITSHPVMGIPNPVFFTATAMIGMIALAGIVVRNGIILIDFIKHAVARGTPLQQAIIESGAVRFRPIFLTAGAAMLGAWPITLDPIFSGLAWSLIFGLFVSTAFTLLVIPAVYMLIFGKSETTTVPAEEKQP
ncbi:MAG: efflux RND transporter permease subunit [Verrucomicrobia bacterium]|nr:MAG: efflux RND transporter permease subunit [Verrucomicrobiota bacterium]